MPRPVYATIPSLRAAGLSDTTLYPDAVLWDLLELASDLVESLTSQFFGPVPLSFLANGEGKRAVRERNSNKIIELRSVSCVSSVGTSSLVASSRYAVHDRCVRLRPVNTNPSPERRAFVGISDPRFPYDDKNVKVDGVFGCIDQKTKVTTTLAAPLTKGATTICLTDTAEFDEDDLLLVDDKFWVVAQETIVEGDPLTSTIGKIQIDASKWAAASGVPVVCYGGMLRLVKRAVIRTALAHRYLPGSEEELEAERRHRIKREETDNYEIEFFQGGSGGSSAGSAASGTGDPWADSILGRFRCPSISGDWV